MSGFTPPFFLERFFAADGRALSGGKLYYYVAGSTSIPKVVYGDYALTIPLTQPLILDASGTAPQYYMDSGLYQVVVQSSTGTVIATRDNVAGAGAGSSTGDHKVLVDAGDTVADYLANKVNAGPGITLSVQSVSGNDKLLISNNGTAKVSGSDTFAGYLSSKFVNGISTNVNATSSGYQTIAIDVVAGPVVNKVCVDSIDTPDYLSTKFINSSTINIGVDSVTNKIKADATGLALTGDRQLYAYSGDTIPGYLVDKLSLSGALASSIGTNVLNIKGTGQVGYDSTDIVDYLPFKIKAGSGISITTTTDITHGIVMWINNVSNNYHQFTYITTNYTVLDTDDTIVNVGTTSITITLPTPSSLYSGRVVLVQNSSLISGASIVAVSGSIVGNTPGVITYQQQSFMCVNTNGSTWSWVCK